jgi:hypothetical protein
MTSLIKVNVGTAATGCPVEQSSTGFMRALSLIMAALREIFDESAYARFLSRRQMASSREAYAAFCREYDTAKARRPRCC